MDYKPTGVCSRLIHVELDGDKIAKRRIRRRMCR